MKFFLSLFCLLSMGTYIFGQKSDSAALARRDSLRLVKMMEKATYPLIKTAQMGGVIPVTNIEELPDINQSYKLLFDFSQGATTPNKAKEINSARAETARIINLHIAAGIPQKNLELVVIAHGPALFSMIDNAHYQKKFHIDNPNITLINELAAAGVKFTACGQAMQFLNIEKASLVPIIKVGLSAKTVTSSYRAKGFQVTDISE